MSSPSIITEWLYKYIWVAKQLDEVPHIALEAEAMIAGVVNEDEPRYYIEDVIVVEESDSFIFVHRADDILH